MISPASRRRLPWVALATVVCLLLAGSVALGAPDTVQGDKVTIMGNSDIPAGTVVTGDAVTVMGNSVIDGKVMGNVSSVMGNVTINGEVNGDVTAVMGNIDLRPGARVHGQINVALGQVNRAPGSSASDVRVDNGGVNISGLNISSLGNIPRGIFLGIFAPWIILSRWLVDLALALLVVALFPGAIKGIAINIEGEPGRAAITGLIALLAAIPIGLVLLITLIGPVVWALFLVVAGFFGTVAVSALIGRKVNAAVRPAEPGQASSLVWDVLIGVSLLALLRFVPVAGGLVRFVVTLIGLGAALLTRFGTNQPWFRRAT